MTEAQRLPNRVVRLCYMLALTPKGQATIAAIKEYFGYRSESQPRELVKQACAYYMVEQHYPNGIGRGNKSIVCITALGKGVAERLLGNKCSDLKTADLVVRCTACKREKSLPREEVQKIACLEF